MDAASVNTKWNRFPQCGSAISAWDETMSLKATMARSERATQVRHDW
jgi:hypothetical protein